MNFKPSILSLLLLAGCRPEPSAEPVINGSSLNVDGDARRFELSDTASGLRLFDTGTGNVWYLTESNTWRKLPSPYVAEKREQFDRMWPKGAR